MARITADEAEARASQWEAQHEDQLRAASADYCRDANARDLVEMWRTGKNIGRVRGPLATASTFGCLENFIVSDTAF
jgi:hypothetical protein